MFCNQCGQANPDSTQTCAACGAPLRQPVAQTAQAQPFQPPVQPSQPPPYNPNPPPAYTPPIYGQPNPPPPAPAYSQPTPPPPAYTPPVYGQPNPPPPVYTPPVYGQPNPPAPAYGQPNPPPSAYTPPVYGQPNPPAPPAYAQPNQPPAYGQPAYQPYYDQTSGGVQTKKKPLIPILIGGVTLVAAVLVFFLAILPALGGNDGSIRGILNDLSRSMETGNFSSLGKYAPGGMDAGTFANTLKNDYDMSGFASSVTDLRVTMTAVGIEYNADETEATVQVKGTYSAKVNGVQQEDSNTTTMYFEKVNGSWKFSAKTFPDSYGYDDYY